MWFFENDKTKPVITAQEHIKSGCRTPKIEKV